MQLLLAFILASIQCGTKIPMKVMIRSKAVYDLLSKDLEEEDKDFHGCKDGGLLRTLLGRLRMHRADIFLYDKSEEQPGMKARIAITFANKVLTSHNLMILPPILVELHLSGMNLAKMSQAVAY